MDRDKRVRMRGRAAKGVQRYAARFLHKKLPKRLKWESWMTIMIAGQRMMMNITANILMIAVTCMMIRLKSLNGNVMKKFKKNSKMKCSVIRRI